MVDAEFRMAFFAISPRSFTFSFRKFLHSGHEVDPFRHSLWKEWKQPCKSVQSLSWVEMLRAGKSHCFVWSGLISPWYPRGKTIVFILFLEPHIVGSVTWVEALLFLVFFEGKRICFGLREILRNKENSTWAHLTFKNEVDCVKMKTVKVWWKMIWNVIVYLLIGK